MAVGVTKLGTGRSTVNGFSTGAVAWAPGSLGVVFVASAVPGGASVTDHAVTGGGVTWSHVASTAYASRRRISMFISSATPADGPLTITAFVTGTYIESLWAVVQVDGLHPSTPHGPTLSSAVPDPPEVTSLSLPDLGGFGEGSIAIFAAGFEDSSQVLEVQAGSEQLGDQIVGTDTRVFVLGTSTTDTTPGVQWQAAGNGCGLVGAIFHAASSAGAVTGTSSLSLPALAIASVAAAIVQAGAALGLPAPAVTATATATVQAEATIALPALGASGAATAPATASGALALPALTVVGSSSSLPSTTATGALGLPALAIAGTATAPATAGAVLALPGLATEGTAVAPVAAGAGLVLAGLDVSGEAAALASAGGNLALPALGIAAAAAQQLIGALQVTVEVAPAVRCRAVVVRPAVGTEAAVGPGVDVGATAGAAVAVATTVSPGG